jgi:hypothetical protein
MRCVDRFTEKRELGFIIINYDIKSMGRKAEEEGGEQATREETYPNRGK